MSHQSYLVGYASDLEGSYDYWRRYVRQSRIFQVNKDDNQIDLMNDCHFVCGGDVVDRGNGDLRILSELIDLKKRFPERVHFILGNRDINKLRLLTALHSSILALPPRVYWYKKPFVEGVDFQLHSLPARLQWVSFYVLIIRFVY
jgi:hypothetical protein